MKRALFSCILLAVILFPGYLISTGGNSIIGNNSNSALTPSSNICENTNAREMLATNSVSSRELDPERINLLSWNSHKGAKPGWLENFVSLAQDADLIALQEGHLTERLVDTLDSNQYSWDIASAFTLNNMPTGVLTASKANPSNICATWDKEPLLSIPKTAMITEYPVKERPDTLLLVNVHMINFTLGTSDFSAQLDKIEKILRQHNGPVIFAGDFNTWSEARIELLQQLADKTQLKPVDFQTDNRSQFFGRVVDHIYSRGLNVLETHSVESEFSDHNPLMATFSYPPASLASDDSVDSTLL